MQRFCKSCTKTFVHVSVCAEGSVCVLVVLHTMQDGDARPVTCSGLWPLGGAHQSPHGLVPAVTSLPVETVPST